MTPQEEHEYVVNLLEDNGYGEDDNITIFDGRDGFGYSFYSALIGVSDQGPRAVYDYNKMLEYLVNEHGFSLEDAADFVCYNAIGACVGNDMPIIIYPLERSDDPRTEDK